MSNTSEDKGFQVRARAVDLLGRQQIAGIPSALHEVFKNAYDAFASRVEVDLFPKSQTVIIRDNGFGMTYDDFTNKWLTLGTESKLGKRTINAPWLGERGEKPRVLMGEKGIGRLAIAAIGPVVMVLTRASRQNRLHNIVASIVPWRLFEVPGINLSRIVIPVLEIDNGQLPDDPSINSMVDRITSNIFTLLSDGSIDQKTSTEVLKEVKMMQFSLKNLLPTLEDGKPGEELSLQGEKFGTMFIIRPYDQILDLELPQNEEDYSSKLSKMLIGFSNTMLPDIGRPPIKTAFRVNAAEESKEIISTKTFFTPEEFLKADQIISGTFDEFGKFKGTVKIFDQAPLNYTKSWNSLLSKKTLCGPFTISFAYLQGNAYESLLPVEDWLIIRNKLNVYGGLYIYKDGIRMLPYGDSDFDWLRIESRRTLAAKDWYFSYRRIFGAVVLTSENNSALQEKAGREGFRENLAYRQIKEILEDFFKQLAKDFFRTASPYGEDFNRVKDDLNKKNDILIKRKKLKSEKKKQFTEGLENFFLEIEIGSPKQAIENIKKEYGEKIEQLNNIKKPGEFDFKFADLQQGLRLDISDIRKKYSVTRPPGIGLSKTLEAEWAAYRKTQLILEDSIYQPTYEHFQNQLNVILQEKGPEFDRMKMVREVITSSKEEQTKQVKQENQESRSGLENFNSSIKGEMQNSILRFNNEIDDIFSDYQEATSSNELTQEGILKLMESLQNRIDEVGNRENTLMRGIRNQLDSIVKSLEMGLLADEVEMALETDNEQLKEELANSTYWAQVGMALGIVQHEFNSTVHTIKKDINKLRPWASGTPELKDLFNELRSGFSHLEEYLRLFAPLERRMRRNKTELTGDEIYGYVFNVFKERFDRHTIRFSATTNFKAQSLLTFPSTIFPVFLNLVDNACFWLKTETPENRSITLDSHPDGLIVMNSGPGIEIRHAEQIFDFGFTLKSDGRGMGLSIARRALRAENMDIELLNPGIESFPRFLIRFNSTDLQENELG